MREFVVLKNRTDQPVTFTYGGERVTVKPSATHTVDTEVARFLYSCDQLLGVARNPDGTRRAAYKLGIESGPDSLLDQLESEVFECASFEAIAISEHPDLAARREMKLQKVANDPSDYHVGVAAVR